MVDQDTAMRFENHVSEFERELQDALQATDPRSHGPDAE